MPTSISYCAKPRNKPQTRVQKDKRNARQRRLVATKKKTMERLQEQLEVLEQEKQDLLALMTLQMDTETKVLKEDEEVGNSSPMSPSASTTSLANMTPLSEIKRRYIEVVTHIEHLRQENRALTAALYRLSILRDAIEEVVAHDDMADDPETALTTVDAKVPRRIQMNAECCLSEYQAAILGRMYITQMLAMQRHIHHWEHDQLPEQFGWSNLRGSKGECSQFAVRKVIYNETALSLWEKTWRAYTTLDSIHCIFPNYLNGPLVHTFDDQIAVVDGTIDSEFAQGVVFHARNRSADGSRALFGLTAVNPVELGTHAIMHRPFSSTTFYLFEDVQDDEPNASPRVQVHYVVSVEDLSERDARKLMTELAVGVVRWESVCVGPAKLLRF